MNPDRATQYLSDGYSCSEAVLLAVSEEYGVENEIIPRIASRFGGGMGLTGSVCGAVSGAVMAMGLILEPVSDRQEFHKSMLPVQEFRRRFEAEMETIICRELTGVDLTQPEAFEEYINSDLPQKVCSPAVETAYRLVMDILEEEKKHLESGSIRWMGARPVTSANIRNED